MEWTMKFGSNAALLLGVLALSVLLLSAVQSGRVSGVITPGPLGSVGLRVENNTVIRTRVSISSVTTLTGGGGTTKTKMTMTQISSEILPPTPSYDILSSEWLVVILAASLVLIGALYLRIPSRGAVTVDLEGDFAQMHEEMDKIERAADYKLRNAALVRYYSVVRKICSRMGLTDDKSETPKEYISRLSAKLRVDSSQARDFATAVDEAMYGVELAPERVRGLTKFMGDFVEDIRRVSLGG